MRDKEAQKEIAEILQDIRQAQEALFHAERKALSLQTRIEVVLVLAKEGTR